MDLTADKEKFVKGWSESYQASDSMEWDFTYDDNCFIKFTLEEQDSEVNTVDVEKTTYSTQSCNVDVPCTDTPFAYAPCWVKGDSETKNED
jgi:hypothetical protein